VRVPGGGLRSPALWLLTAVAVAGAVLLGVGLVTGSARSADLAADRGAGPVVAVPQVALTSAPPVALVVPALGLDTRLVGLHTGRDGELQVDADPTRAGWYADGPAPGDLGPAVLAGHLDSPTGPGVFAGLDALAPGDRIAIRRADGTTVQFAVNDVQTYAKRAFPTARVYAGTGTPALRIITCGGRYDPDTGRYRSNTIVFADQVGGPSVPGAEQG
jgi:hypothetical protein